MDARVIDTRHVGRERAIACYDLGGLLVDPGPEPSLDGVLEQLTGEPRAVLLTHIHLDHAGATGALVRRFPEVEVWVHERGAPHLIDPAKLIASASRLYGEDMERLWGEIVPVPQSNVRTLQGGERITVQGREFDARYTPGHASHHVIYLDRRESIVYAGDVAGVRIPPSRFTMAPTPPPDIDIEAWKASIETVREFEPERIALTHFGFADDPQDQLDSTIEALDRQAAAAKDLIDRGVDPAQAEVEFATELERRLREQSDPETAAVAMQASSPRQLWMGLQRYWAKVAAGSNGR